MTSDLFPPSSQQPPAQPQWQQQPQPPRERSRSLTPVVLLSAAAVVVVVGSLLVFRAVVMPRCDALGPADVEQVVGQPFEVRPPVSEDVAEMYEVSRDAGICRYEFETPEGDIASEISVTVVVFPDEETLESFEAMVWRTVDPEEGETVRNVDGLGEAARAIVLPDPEMSMLYVKTADRVVFLNVSNVRRDEDWSLPLEEELAHVVLERIT